MGTADALAFFLPGIVSRVSKALYVSKSMISGASGSSVSLEQAILGLIESLIIVLSDKESLHELGPSHDDVGTSTESVLDLLRHMPTSLQNQSKENGASLVHQRIREDMRGSTTFVLKRTKEWIQETAANVDKMLSAIFPHVRPCLEISPITLFFVRNRLDHITDPEFPNEKYIRRLIIGNVKNQSKFSS